MGTVTSRFTRRQKTVAATGATIPICWGMGAATVDQWQQPSRVTRTPVVFVSRPTPGLRPRARGLVSAPRVHNRPGIHLGASAYSMVICS